MCKKIASSSEAFRKFGIWKNSKTALKLTVVINGGVPHILRGRVFASDEDSLPAGFFVTAKNGLVQYGFDGATFRVGKKSVEVNRGDDFLTFEPL